MAALLKNTNRKAQQVDYFALRKTKMPAAIVEIGFITNPKEDELLRDPLYQSKVAWSIAAGIIKYYADLEERENQKIDEKNKEILETFRQQPGQDIPARWIENPPTINWRVFCINITVLGQKQPFSH